MSAPGGLRRALRWGALGLGVAAAGYGTVVAGTWLRYGDPAPPAPDEADPVLDEFVPSYEVAERHSVRVQAPADVVLRAATQLKLEDSPVVWAIFRTRELVLGANRSAEPRPAGLADQMAALGWRVLHETPGREIVTGAVTQPWLANVVFRGLPPEQFKAFQEPDFVKIAWTLRADPVGPDEAIFRTETRVATTDAGSRARFRWYWARFSPGIVLIRWFMLRQVKAEAERATHVRVHLKKPS
jgi:hypothetical protein